ncbi:hypothetical protein [Candidatus Nanohalococcus occultus]|uniref:hypothetical protein n=1 Tax=Candidatus Nanohalococcus occultus TaxID=2978047 RepID=UPI0039DF642C
MASKDQLILLIGALSGTTAYYLYPEIGLASALMIIFAVSWFLWGLTTKGKALNTVSFLKNPPIAAFMGFIGSFIYLSFEGYSSANTWLFAFGIALLSGLVSIMLNTLWSIGGD